MLINKADTAVVFIDPQNEVLREKGLAWPFVGESVTESKTVENKEGVIAAPPMHEKDRRRPAAKLFVSESDAIALHEIHGRSFTFSSKAGKPLLL